MVGPMTNEKPISLGEDDLKLMKELGVAVDPEHHWAARMAGRNFLRLLAKYPQIGKRLSLTVLSAYPSL